MPCIQIHVSSKISEKAEVCIKTTLGKKIEIIPGKTENWLMITMRGEETIYFKGDKSKPAAYVFVGLYGDEDSKNFNSLTACICQLLNAELSVPMDRIYVQYATTHFWGWNGANF